MLPVVADAAVQSGNETGKAIESLRPFLAAFFETLMTDKVNRQLGQSFIEKILILIAAAIVRLNRTIKNPALRNAVSHRFL